MGSVIGVQIGRFLNAMKMKHLFYSVTNRTTKPNPKNAKHLQSTLKTWNATVYATKVTHRLFHRCG
jgi:hypothetical protein